VSSKLSRPFGRLAPQQVFRFCGMLEVSKTMSVA
jgi:hypothetical protein